MGSNPTPGIVSRVSKDRWWDENPVRAEEQRDETTEDARRAPQVNPTPGIGYEAENDHDITIRTGFEMDGFVVSCGVLHDLMGGDPGLTNVRWHQCG